MVAMNIILWRRNWRRFTFYFERRWGEKWSLVCIA